MVRVPSQRLAGSFYTTKKVVYISALGAAASFSKVRKSSTLGRAGRVFTMSHNMGQLSLFQTTVMVCSELKLFALHALGIWVMCLMMQSISRRVSATALIRVF